MAETRPDTNRTLRLIKTVEMETFKTIQGKTRQITERRPQIIMRNTGHRKVGDREEDFRTNL